MSQIVVQDVRSPFTPSEILEGPHFLRPNARRVAQGWVCRCVEGGTLWSGCCGESLENLLRQRLTDDHPRELQVLFSSWMLMC